MGEYSLDTQVIHGLDPFHEVWQFIGRHPQTSHAGIDFEMHSGGFALLFGLLGERPSQIQCAEGGGQVVVNQVLNFVGKQAVEDENGRGDSVLPEFNAFFENGHSQTVSPGFQRGFSAGNRTVPVAVRLNDGHGPDPGTRNRSHSLQVMLESVEVDFRDGRPLSCHKLLGKRLGHSRRVLPVADRRPCFFTSGPEERMGRHPILPSSEFFFRT